MCSTRRRNRNAVGFTLVELLVVISVIVLLMGMLLPVIQSSTTRARTTECCNNLQQLGKAVVMYTGNYRGFYPSPAHADDIADLNDSSRYDGDPNFSNSDDPPYAWRGKILPYTGTRSARTFDLRYEVYRCPSVRAFRGHKSFYGFNAYLGMHTNPERLRDPDAADGVFRMVHSDDVEQPSTTFLLGENNTGHWAVKPKNPRLGTDFAAASDDAVVHARHLGKSCWVYADNHARAMEIREAEERNCFPWFDDKTKARL